MTIGDTKMVTWVRVLVCALASVACSTSDTHDDDGDLETASAAVKKHHLEGELEISGCTTTAKQLRVYAAPVTMTLTDPAGSLQRGHGDPGNSGHLRHAHVKATNRAGVFTVRFEGLETARGYRLGARSIAPGCEKVQWRGPQGGLVVAGDPRPLALTGRAITTEIEVLAQRGEIQRWVAIDAIDLTAEVGAIRTLRWRTRVPGAVGGVLRVATEPFDGIREVTQPLIASVVPLAPGEWTQIETIDFASLVRPPCAEDLCAPDPFGRAVRQDLLAGAPVYIQISPTDGAGQRISDNGITAIVKLAHVVHLQPDVPSLERASAFDITTAPVPASPEIQSVHSGPCFRVIKPHTVSLTFTDPYGFQTVASGLAQEGETLQPGQMLCFEAAEGDFFSDVADAFSGAIDELGAAVDYVSKLYADIKNAIVDFVASVIDELEIIDCDSACRALLMAALDTGLAALGLPPSIPSWNELVERGSDYLVDQVAEQTGLPREAVELIADKMIESVSASRSTGVVGADWLTPDDGFVPPMVELTIRRNPNFAGDTPNMLMLYPTPFSTNTNVFLPSAKLAADGTVRIPITLQPNFAGFAPPAPFCFTDLFGIEHCIQPTPERTLQHFKNLWLTERYTQTPCTALQAEGRLAFPGTPFTFTQGIVYDVAYPTLSTDVLPTWETKTCTP